MSKKYKIWKENPKDIFISRGSAFEESFRDYFANSKTEKLRTYLRKREYTVGDSDVSSRIITHWDSLGILPEPVKNDGWRKFTLIELVWLRSVNHMREFGLSLNKIVRVKEFVLDWDNVGKNYPLFEYYVACAWISTSDPYLAVLQDGNADLASSSELENSKFFYGTKNILLISLKSILTDMGVEVKGADTLWYLDEKEKDLFVAMERGSEVKVKMKNKKISEMEFAENIDNPDMREINEDMRKLGDFGEVITNYSNGVRQSAKVVKRRRFKE